DHAAGRIYNLTGSETVTIKQIAETVSGLIGNTEVVHTPARPGDFGGKLVSSERAARELDWRATTPFAEGVRRYVTWRRSLNGNAPAELTGCHAEGPGPSAEGRPRVLI